MADVVRERHAAGKAFVKPVHVAHALDGHDGDARGTRTSVGTHLTELGERGALSLWSSEAADGRTVWEIVDVDALPERAVADGGQR